MSWKIRERYRAVLAAEEGSSARNWGGKLTVCLVYPNHYATAMGNLGFQAVYAMINSFSGAVCERAFLPPDADLAEYGRSGSRLLSLESQRPLTDFDVVAFSVSFENDYLNIARILDLAGIPPFSADRSSSFPLLIAGGAALFLNPEPVADLLDLVCVGEAEPMLPPLLGLMCGEEGAGRREFLLKASRLPGIYVPCLYTYSYSGCSVTAIENHPAAAMPVRRIFDPDLGQSVVASALFAPDIEFADMYLIEVSRGCPRGCRFCAAGFIYHPYRPRPLELIRAEAARGLSLKRRIGLVGAAVSDHPDLGGLCRWISDRGGKVSVSSLRIDALDDALLDVLHSSGHKTVALAPEGGSQRLRDLVRKGINEQQILNACDRLIDRDILNLKLYFIIGLPTETMGDLEEMVSLVGKIRERVVMAARKNRRLGSILLSVNPFVPKPFTPLQWCGMERPASLEKKYAFLRRAAGKLPNVKIQLESLREAYLQALLSRGDRRLGALLVTSGKTGSWKRAARELSIDTDILVHRNIPLDEILPWDIIDGGCREELLSEYSKALSGAGG